MALDINGYNETFKAFVDFAQAKAAQNEKKAVARGTLENGELAGRQVTAADTDYVHKRRRSENDKTANDRTRDMFKAAVIDMFGGEARIPKAVRKAMLMDDYGEGKPLTARRIIAVKKAIDADGAMRERGVSQFRSPETRNAALALGYREPELAKLARAVNFYSQTRNCTETQALQAVSEPGSKANRLLDYGGRFLENAENFADGLRLLDLFATWHGDLSTYVTDLRNRVRMRSRRDYSTADTLTKLNAEYGFVTPECRSSHERFVFEALACDPKANLKATVGEEIFGAGKNSATSFVCQGFGMSAWSTVAQIPPDKRAIVFKAFDRLCVLARDPEAAKTDVGVRHFESFGASLAIARMIKNIDALAALAARGKLTAKNIVATCFPDLHVAGRYETAKLHRAFRAFSDALSDDGAASLQITKIMQDTGCTLAEARAAYYDGADIPKLPYVAGHGMNLDGLNSIDSARVQLTLDLSRPDGYSEITAPNRPLLDAGQTCFNVAFPDGERFAASSSPAGRENAGRIAQKIEDMCGRVHPRQTASVMSLLSQSGLAALRGGLKRYNIQSNEHSPVDFTFARNDDTGDVTIRYSSPKGLKFMFEWTATVRLDGSVETTPMRFADANTVAADVAAASARIKAQLAQVLPEEADIQGPAVDKLLESARTDRDLMAFLQRGNNPMAVQGIMLGDGNRLRSEEEIAKRLEALRGNINELRAATKGDRRLFDTVMRALEPFEGKALKPGMITKMCEAAKKVDLRALKNVSANSSPARIAEALCAFEKGATQMVRETGMLATMGRVVGGAEFSACISLGLSLICLRLEEDALRGLQAGLGSLNSAKFSVACELLHAREFPDGNTRPENVRAAISGVANSIGSHFSSMRTSIEGAIVDALGVEFDGNRPEVEQITPAEFKAVYKVLEKHTLEVHRDRIAQQ